MTIAVDLARKATKQTNNLWIIYHPTSLLHQQTSLVMSYILENGNICPVFHTLEQSEVLGGGGGFSLL